MIEAEKGNSVNENLMTGYILQNHPICSKSSKFTQNSKL